MRKRASARMRLPQIVREPPSGRPSCGAASRLISTIAASNPGQPAEGSHVTDTSWPSARIGEPRHDISWAVRKQIEAWPANPSRGQTRLKTSRTTRSLATSRWRFGAETRSRRSVVRPVKCRLTTTISVRFLVASVRPSPAVQRRRSAVCGVRATPRCSPNGSSAVSSMHWSRPRGMQGIVPAVRQRDF